MKFTKNSLLVSTMLAVSVMALSSTTASAQDVENEEIIVTGTRLNVNPNLSGANPALTIDDLEIASRGVVTIEDLVNNLPQAFAGQAGEVANGATGTSTLNIRGLGATRTLTLINGRRLPFGDSQSSSVNLDLVPTGLVDRVDVLTGGASAVYGSDAVAGVANFILKRDFEGVELDAQYGFSQNSNGIDVFDDTFSNFGGTPVGGSTDGDELNIAATIGVNSDDGKGNLVLHAAFQNREEITQDNRSFSQCSLDLDDTSPTGLNCFGSANFRLFGGPGGFTFQEADGEIVPFTGTSDQRFNFGPLNFFQRPQERFQFFTQGHYEYAPGHEVFAEASYVDTVSDAQIAQTASFGIGAYSINCDNPFLQGSTGTPLTEIFGCSAADIAAGNVVDGITASHRNIEGGPRNSRLENSAFRLVGGARGTVEDKFDYEVFAQYAETSDQDVSTNDFIVSNLQQAFLVREVDGVAQCIDPSGGCVPYNIFQRGPNGETLVTQEATDFIQGIGITNGNTEQLVIGGNIQSDLGNFGVSSPYAEEGVALLVGLEYREDSLDARPDQISQTPGGGFTGVGGANLPVSGTVDVFEIYGEVQVPLITGAQFAEELVFNAEYRNSDYSADGNGVSPDFNTDTYGLELSWVPVEDIKLRGQYQRAVRAPNVIELFTGQDQGLDNLNSVNGLFDPCATANPTATAAQCANTGVTGAQFGNILDVISGQTSVITGGNPGLQPEVSDTFTIGAIFTPSFLDGLTISVDYFDISVDEFIGTISPQIILDECLETGEAAFCDLISRDPLGSLNSGTAGVGFQATLVNIASVETSGFDIQAGYDFDIADGRFGNLGIQYASTILNKFENTPFPGADVIECEGNVSNACTAALNSKYRHRVLTRWDTPLEGLDITGTWRLFSGNDTLGADPDAFDARLDSVNYFDFSGSYEVKEGLTFRAGVNNAFLEQPPVSLSIGAPAGNGNTLPASFDTGRFFFFGANLKL